MKRLIRILFFKLLSKEMQFDLAFRAMYLFSDEMNSKYSLLKNDFHRVEYGDERAYKKISFIFLEDSKSYSFLEKYEDRKYKKSELI